MPFAITNARSSSFMNSASGTTICSVGSEGAFFVDYSSLDLDLDLDLVLDLDLDLDLVLDLDLDLDLELVLDLDLDLDLELVLVLDLVAQLVISGFPKSKLQGGEDGSGQAAPVGSGLDKCAGREPDESAKRICLADPNAVSHAPRAIRLAEPGWIRVADLAWFRLADLSAISQADP